MERINVNIKVLQMLILISVWILSIGTGVKLLSMLGGSLSLLMFILSLFNYLCGYTVLSFLLKIFKVIRYDIKLLITSYFKLSAISISIGSIIAFINF